MTNGGRQADAQSSYRSTPPDEFFRTLAAASPDAILSVTPDGTIRYANDSVEPILGYTADELLGESIGAVVPDRFHESFRRQAKRYLSDGVKPVNWDGAELLGEHKDGTEVPLSVTIVEHSVGDQRRFTAVARDISRRMEREDDLVREVDQLRQATETVERIDDTLSDADAALQQLRGRYDDDAIDDLEAAHKRLHDALARARRHRDAADEIEAAESE